MCRHRTGMLAVMVALLVSGCNSPSMPAQEKNSAGDRQSATLAEAKLYFRDGDSLLAESQRCAKELNSEGVWADGVEISEGAVETMKRSGIMPPGDRSVREFMSLYKDRRHESLCTGRKGPATHRETIDCLVSDGKFGQPR